MFPDDAGYTGYAWPCCPVGPEGTPPPTLPAGAKCDGAAPEPEPAIPPADTGPCPYMTAPPPCGCCASREGPAVVPSGIPTPADIWTNLGPRYWYGSYGIPIGPPTRMNSSWLGYSGLPGWQALGISPAEMRNVYGQRCVKWRRRKLRTPEHGSVSLVLKSSVGFCHKNAPGSVKETSAKKASEHSCEGRVGRAVRNIGGCRGCRPAAPHRCENCQELHARRKGEDSDAVDCWHEDHIWNEEVSPLITVPVDARRSEEGGSERHGRLVWFGSRTGLPSREPTLLVKGAI